VFDSADKNKCFFVLGTIFPLCSLQYLPQTAESSSSSDRFTLLQLLLLLLLRKTCFFFSCQALLRLPDLLWKYKRRVPSFSLILSTTMKVIIVTFFAIALSSIWMDPCEAEPITGILKRLHSFPRRHHWTLPPSSFRVSCQPCECPKVLDLLHRLVQQQTNTTQRVEPKTVVIMKECPSTLLNYTKLASEMLELDYALDDRSAYLKALKEKMASAENELIVD
jgi:hypothetical protein